MAADTLPIPAERVAPAAVDGPATVTVDPVAWVETAARLVIDFDATGVPDACYAARLPLSLERAVVGRPAEELPRIWPAQSSVSAVAHHLASARALDQVFGVTPPPAGEALRRALLLADFVRTHSRRLAIRLAAPDSPLGGAGRRHWPAPRHGVSSALIGDLMRGAALAQDALDIVGGRAGLPICAVPGGVARALDEANAARLQDVAQALLVFARRTQAALHATLDARSPWQAFFDGPAFCLPLASLALFGEHGVDWLGSQLRAVAVDGVEIARFAPAEHADHIAEWVEPGSGQRFAHLKDRGWTGLEADAPGLFRVGPLARLNASGQPLSVAGVSERLQLMETHSVAACLWASLIELLDASEMLATLSQDPIIIGPAVRVLPTQVVGEGAAAVEGPAGVVVHAYRSDARGLVRQARVLDPLVLNHAACNLAARQAARLMLRPGRPDDGALRLIEFAVAAC